MCGAYSFIACLVEWTGCLPFKNLSRNPAMASLRAKSRNLVVTRAPKDFSRAPAVEMTRFLSSETDSKKPGALHEYSCGAPGIIYRVLPGCQLG